LSFISFLLLKFRRSLPPVFYGFFGSKWDKITVKGGQDYRQTLFLGGQDYRQNASKRLGQHLHVAPVGLGKKTARGCTPTTLEFGADMAKIQSALPLGIVKKHNDIVRARIHIGSIRITDARIGVHASNILASLVAEINEGDDCDKQYSVSVNKFIEGGGNSYKYIRKTCHFLKSAFAEIERVELSSNRPELVLRSFFSEIVYKNGVIYAIFNKRMHPYLFELKERYTSYELAELIMLPTFYSKRLFEILWSYARSYPEATIPLVDLHFMMSTPKSFEDNFKDFRRRVLEKAYNDIKKTSLKFEWEPVKKGRSVEAVRFIFSQKRIAIAQASASEAAKNKQSKENNTLARAASQCAKEKKGACTEQDNKKKVCNLCVRLELCDSIRAHIIKTARG